eukprot:jgi/Psemu1/23117/gm1.23117_g
MRLQQPDALTAGTRPDGSDSMMNTYSEYFQSTASPFGNTPADRNGAYSILYGNFAALDLTPFLDQLLNPIEAQAVCTLVGLVFVADSLGESARLRLVHGLRKYPGTLTQQASPNKGKSFGFLDDIEGDAGELVQVNVDMLAKTPASGVLSLGHHIAELDAHRQHSYLIPLVPEGVAHSEVVSAYKIFFIPFELVLFLLGKGLTPWQAMEILYPYLNHQGLVGICAPLFETLRVAGTFPAEPASDPTFIQPGPSFQIKPSLLTIYMRNKVLYRDLPSLNRPPVPPGDPALTAAVTALTDHQLRLSEDLDQRGLQSVGGTWGPLYTKCLLLLCGQLEEADLPPIYQKSKHKKTHMVFQSQVATRASKFGIQAPLVTTKVLKRLQDCNFHGTDPFDTWKQEQEAAANVAAYDTTISTEGNSLTLKNSLELQRTKPYIPVDWTEATTQLESYLAVLATILGVTHEALITPEIVVYYFQIRVRGWLEEQWESAFTIPSPDFGEDFHWFQMTQNLNWLPNVSNVVALRLLCRPDPPQASNAGSNGNSNSCRNALVTLFILSVE